MKLTDENVFTIATWETSEGSFRAVRGINEKGVRMLYGLLRWKSWNPQAEERRLAQKWEMVHTGQHRDVILLGGTDTDDEWAIARFSYLPKDAGSGGIFTPVLPGEKPRKVRPEEVAVLTSAWYEVLGWRGPVRGTERFTVPDEYPSANFVLDPSIYRMLGVPYPWSYTHFDFLEWLESVS